MATVGSPKKLNKPVSAKVGYLEKGTAELENQPANKTKLNVNILPRFGKLNDVEMMTSAVDSAPSGPGSNVFKSSLALSASTGSTTKMLPVANAVMSAVLAGPTRSLYLKGVRLATRAGRTQKVSNTDATI